MSNLQLGTDSLFLLDSGGQVNLLVDISLQEYFFFIVNWKSPVLIVSSYVPFIQKLYHHMIWTDDVIISFLCPYNSV